jgi:hypothetical protein
VGIALYGARNLPSEELWFDETMQIHTSLGVQPMGRPFLPAGSIRDVVARNAADQLDPGGYGVLLHVWMSAFGPSAWVLRSASGLLSLLGLAALAALAGRWLRHPLAPPAAVALALVDPLVREHALEVRPYALELAGVWLAFWAADRLVARPDPSRAALFGLVLVALLGSRYSAFLTGAALTGAVALELWRRTDGARRGSVWTFVAMAAPPALAITVIAVCSIPGFLRRATWGGGALVGYFDAQKLGALAPGEAILAALRHLSHPAAVGLTIAAVLSVGAGLRLPLGAPAPRATVVVRRAALFLLVVTIAVWPWHPWEPATKWSLYLRVVSTLCVVRLAAEMLSRLAGRRSLLRAAAVAALGLVTLGAWRVAAHERWRWDVALPALERLGAVLGSADAESAGAVAVDPHPMPAVRYHYELGSLRGRREYPRAFLLPIGGRRLPPEEMCRARFLLSFDSIASLERRYPSLRFEEDPVADQLLRVLPADPAAGPCAPADGAPTSRGSSGGAR